MSRLPMELLDIIFGELCGKEVLAVRSVCTDWEKASRPFFAEGHLKRSLFWLTGSDLRRLERLACRFGPHMGTIYIATDHFTIAGLRQVWRNYTQHRDYLNNLANAVSDKGPRALLTRASRDSAGTQTRSRLIGSVAQPLHDADKHGSEYFRHAYQQRQPLSPWKHLRLYSFLWQYLCNIISQTFLRLTGQDRRKLARIAEMIPNGRLEAVKMSYAGARLNKNVYLYGRAAPRFSPELALLCGKGDGLVDEGYGEYVGRVVRDAEEVRALWRSGGDGDGR